MKNPKSTIHGAVNRQRKSSLPPTTDSPHLKRVEGWQKHLIDGVLRAKVLVKPQGPHFDRIIQAVDIINTVQSYYRLDLEFDKRGAFLKGDDKPRKPDPIRKNIQRRFADQLVIAITEHDLNDNDTISEAPGCTIISADWRGDSPVTRVYLVFQLTSALISFASCLTEAENEDLLHSSDDEDDDEDGDIHKGCLFDYWTDSEKLYLSMVGSRLCNRCRSLLQEHGTPPQAIAATEKLLDWVRSVIVGRERPLPRKIFIGHGRNEDWKLLKDMLEQWSLKVEEFNETPVAGVSISERLKSMLEQSRFAFLVMTGEDKDNEGQLRARMNVVHEIGLFQGRLGTEYAVILRRQDTSVFSNLDGINRLDYKPGKLDELKDEIRQLLIARGVMPANAGA